MMVDYEAAAILRANKAEYDCQLLTYNVLSLKLELSQLRAATRDALRALQALYDIQNGPPPVKYEADWQAAMEKTEAALDNPTIAELLEDTPR